jgi:hypothetical protein
MTGGQSRPDPFPWLFPEPLISASDGYGHMLSDWLAPPVVLSIRLQKVLITSLCIGVQCSQSLHRSPKGCMFCPQGSNDSGLASLRPL